MSALTKVRHHEDLRLAALSRYHLLDTPPEEAYDRITRRAAGRLQAPFALFSLVDRDRVFIKSRYGLDLQQLERRPRRRHSPLLPDEVLWIPDAAAEHCFQSLEDFDAAATIRFYAAAPLKTYDGHTLGTLCVMDRRPREEDAAQKGELCQLATSLMKEIETRRLRRRLETPRRRTARRPARVLPKVPPKGDKRGLSPEGDKWGLSPEGDQRNLGDALDGLATRRQLFDRLTVDLELARRHDGPGSALLVLGIDRLTAINGSLGYDAGDQVLIEAARRLQTSIPAAGGVARLGGDQFGVLLTDLETVARARSLAAEIQARLRWPMPVRGRRLSISASLGLAWLDQAYTRPDEVLRDAEIAMKRAKAGGGGRCKVFDVSRHRSSVEQLERETELHGALARGELRLHYQPIVELGSGRLRGFEALVRWQHPRHGLLRPRDFLALAGTAGLMPAICQWTLGQACRQLVGWQRRFPRGSKWTMSVNIEPGRLADPDFAAQVDRALRTTELAPSRLNLELTETAMVSGSRQSTAMLRQLEERGIALHIDDFGTGYATLSTLHRVPSRALKIDASFVTEMLNDERHHEIVRSIIDLAHNLGLGVIAEGVETPLQLQALRALGCDQGQGFYFSRPLDPASLEELLADETLLTEGTPGSGEALVN